MLLLLVPVPSNPVPNLPILLGVRRKPDTTEAAAHTKGRRFQVQMQKALDRDGYACRCCGFQAARYQRVVPGWLVSSAEDFVTLCRFCEQCFSLDQAGATGGGMLIWLPEITQADLNHIARAIYVARAPDASGNPHPFAEAAGRALDALTARRADAKKRLGSDDPLLLATVFFESLNDAEYAKRSAGLDGVRLLPLDRWMARGHGGDVDQFQTVAKYWASPEGPFGKLKPDAWNALLERASGVAA